MIILRIIRERGRARGTILMTIGQIIRIRIEIRSIKIRRIMIIIRNK